MLVNEEEKETKTKNANQMQKKMQKKLPINISFLIKYGCLYNK